MLVKNAETRALTGVGSRSKPSSDPGLGPDPNPNPNLTLTLTLTPAGSLRHGQDDPGGMCVSLDYRLSHYLPWYEHGTTHEGTANHGALLTMGHYSL